METRNYRIEYLNKFNLTDEQKIFIISYSFERKKFKEIEKLLKEYDSSKKYSDVQKLNIECKYYIDQIQSIRNKFNENRQKDNESFEIFLNWYSNQEQKCGYCGVTQDELHTIFVENQLLPLNDKTKRASGSLEIERKDSKDNSYHISNLILACPLCNNAKSNLIDEESWKEYFIEPMKKYYKSLLDKN